MTGRGLRMVDEILPHLKADLEKTLAEYDKTARLRAQKMLRETEQIKTYLELLESKPDDVKLTSRHLRKLHKLLAWEARPSKKDLTHRRQQDRLEDHFLELQMVLVHLISRRFKY